MNHNSLNSATTLLTKNYSHQLNKPLSKEVMDWITHKIRHSYAVLHVAQNIIARDPILKNCDQTIKKRMEISSLLHDIGRFRQHNRLRVLKNEEYEHGDTGMEILIEEGYLDLAILLSVKHHNKFEITSLYNDFFYQTASDELKAEIDLITKLVRDADKLQNLEYLLFDGGNQFLKLGNDRKQGGSHIKDSLIETYNNGGLVSYNLIESDAEAVLNLLSWKNDIYFDGTKMLLNEFGFEEKMHGILKNIGVEKNIINRLS